MKQPIWEDIDLVGWICVCIIVSRIYSYSHHHHGDSHCLVEIFHVHPYDGVWVNVVCLRLSGHVRRKCKIDNMGQVGVKWMLLGKVPKIVSYVWTLCPPTPYISTHVIKIKIRLSDAPYIEWGISLSLSLYIYIYFIIHYIVNITQKTVFE